MDTEQYEDDPRIQELRQVAQQKSRRRVKTVIASALLLVALGFFLYATHVTRPLAQGDTIGHARLSGKVGKVEPQVVTEADRQLPRLKIWATIVGLKKNMKEEDIKTLAMKIAEKAESKKYEFKSAEGQVERREPASILVQCTLLPNTPSTVALPTITEKNPMLDREGLPREVMLLWRRNGNHEWDYPVPEPAEETEKDGQGPGDAKGNEGK